MKRYPVLKKLIIDRRTWRRGELGEGHVMLKNREGYKCCLGFYCEQVGVEPDLLLEVEDPSVIISDPEVLLTGLSYKTRNYYDALETVTTNLCEYLIDANDRSMTGDAAREKELTRLFKEMGTEVEFIN